MHDSLPDEMKYWHAIEKALRQLTKQYGYEEIRFPIVEETLLFKRTIGEVTDIVEKEMYEFIDRNGISLTLRPEGTAGCVRACIEHGLTYNQVQRLWYMGPMFRHERPQKGRYRQFYQFGLEAFGLEGPDIDAEIILFTLRLWRELGLSNIVKLNVNSIGTLPEREQYRQALVEYFSNHMTALDEDSQQRLQTNPLRILDSKNPAMAPLITNAPKMLTYLNQDSKKHFDDLCHILEKANIDFIVNPTLVRGLDYYTKTVFEWITDELGSQGTVCAGGRYDGLVELLGGKPSPAVGFAMGLERIIELMKIHSTVEPDLLDAYLLLVGEQAEQEGLHVAEKIREKNPCFRLMVHCGGGNFKRQFKCADKSGARLALILGEDEVNNNTISVKFLREDRPQVTLSREEFLNREWI